MLKKIIFSFVMIFSNYSCADNTYHKGRNIELPEVRNDNQGQVEPRTALNENEGQIIPNAFLDNNLDSDDFDPNLYNNPRALDHFYQDVRIGYYRVLNFLKRFF